MAKLSENLAKIMSERGINQVELAKKSGIAQPLISSYLNESARAKLPSLPNLLALARALHCSLEGLTGLEALHDVETKFPVVSDKTMKLAQFIESLSDDDPLKKYLIELQRSKGESHDMEGQGDDPDQMKPK